MPDFAMIDSLKDGVTKIDADLLRELDPCLTLERGNSNIRISQHGLLGHCR